MHHSTPARARRPSDAIRVKALRSRIRQIKRTDCADPWRGGLSKLPGRHGCSCGCGSRASWHDDGCSVGRCVSRNPSSSHVQWRFSRSPGFAYLRHTDWPLVKRRDKTTARIGIPIIGRDWPPLRFGCSPGNHRFLALPTPATVRPSRPNVTCPHRVDKRVEKAWPLGRRCW